MSFSESKEIPLGMRELQPNPSNYIAEALVEHGVDIAFGIHGGHIWQIVDEISRAGIKTITFRHEQAAAYAAEAYSKVTRRPGVCFATAGPGVGNAFSAIQQAHMSCSPVVFIAGGNAPETDYLPIIQPCYVTDIMKNITKFCLRCTETAQVKQVIARAFKSCQSYPKGPAALEMELGMLFKPLPPAIPPLSAYGEHAMYVPKWRGEETADPIPPGGAPEFIERAVQALWSSEKPVIYAADGCHWSDASKALLEFAELSQIPVTTRRIARGCFPEVHPLFLDSRTGRTAIGQSDIRLLLGGKIGSFDSFGFGWPPTIQVNESPDHIWTYLNTPVAIVGDIRVVLEQMIAYIKKMNLTPPESRKEWTAHCRDVQKGGLEARKEKAETYAKHRPVHFGYLAKKAWDVCEDLYGGMNRIILDGYTLSDYMPAFIRARYSGQVMDASEYAGVGHGVGMAIGAAFGDPDARRHPILALMGDAGMGISGTDFETAVIHKLPIVYLVSENRGWLTGMKSVYYGNNWESMGEQDRAYGQEGVENARYDRFCDMFGGHGEYVDDPGEIGPALIRAFKAAENGSPAIVNVHMDPTVSNRQIYSATYATCWAHIPWETLAPRGRAIRRNTLAQFPWEEAGVPPMKMPDPWEPVKDEEEF
ncbi:MAG: thiamine pyrophosphate-binding protein [Desulfobacterales bacterium]